MAAIVWRAARKSFDTDSLVWTDPSPHLRVDSSAELEGGKFTRVKRDVLASGWDRCSGCAGQLVRVMSGPRKLLRAQQLEDPFFSKRQSHSASFRMQPC